MRKIFSIVAVLTALLLSTSCHSTTQKTELQSKAESIVKPYLTQFYHEPLYSYNPVETIVTPLYDYTPSEICDCAEEIADIEWRIEHPNIETDHYYLNTELAQCNDILLEMMDTLQNIDSLKIQTGWLIIHTYRITSNQSSMPSLLFTKTFLGDIDLNTVSEVFEPNKSDMLKRRDIIIDNAIQQSRKKK